MEGLDDLLNDGVTEGGIQLPLQKGRGQPQVDGHRFARRVDGGQLRIRGQGRDQAGGPLGRGGAGEQLDQQPDRVLPNVAAQQAGPGRGHGLTVAVVINREAGQILGGGQRSEQEEQAQGQW